jgi:hypothetical protein
VCVFLCVSQVVGVVKPLWLVCGPSPPPASPSAGCPWPRGNQHTHTHCYTHKLLHTHTSQCKNPHTDSYQRQVQDLTVYYSSTVIS